MIRIYQLALIIITASGFTVEELSMDKYHTHEELTEFLKDLTDKNPSLARLYSIGKSHEGRELWVVEVSAGRDKQQLRPNVKLIGNIHGNEAVGREILLQLAKYLVESYNMGDSRIRGLLDFARVHILPSLNPDGFRLAMNQTKWGGGKQCLSVQGRNNIRDLDLNRNFPDLHHANRAPLQRETEAVMEWLGKIPFVLSASLHGGALVATYPFDSRKEGIWEEFFKTFNTTKRSQSEVMEQWRKWRPGSLK